MKIMYKCLFDLGVAGQNLQLIDLLKSVNSGVSNNRVLEEKISQIEQGVLEDLGMNSGHIYQIAWHNMLARKLDEAKHAYSTGDRNQMNFRIIEIHNIVKGEDEYRFSREELEKIVISSA